MIVTKTVTGQCLLIERDRRCVVTRDVGDCLDAFVKPRDCNRSVSMMQRCNAAIRVGVVTLSPYCQGFLYQLIFDLKMLIDEMLLVEHELVKKAVTHTHQSACLRTMLTFGPPTPQRLSSLGIPVSEVRFQFNT